MNPTWLFFDLDDTLVPQETSVLAALADTCRLVADRCGRDTDELVRILCESADRVWRDIGYSPYVDRLGIAWWEGLWGRFDDGDDPELRRLAQIAPEFRTRAWQALLNRCNVPDAELAATLAQEFITRRQRRHIPYPDTVEVLCGLRTRFGLGLISNGAPDIQKDKLARSGLAGYFAPVVISGDVGVGKPEPAIFHHAMERAGVSADAAVMIGNSIEHDIAGAQSVGMRTVWVKREAVQGTPDVAPDVELPDLRGLVTLFDDAP